MASLSNVQQVVVGGWFLFLGGGLALHFYEELLKMNDMHIIKHVVISDGKTLPEPC